MARAHDVNSTTADAMKYNSKVVLAYFKECGLPEPYLEMKFHPERKWRFDFAWSWEEDESTVKIALEVEGGVWIGGGHNRGAGFVKDMEKYNEAAALGWRVIRVQPKDLCTQETVSLINRCMGWDYESRRTKSTV